MTDARGSKVRRWVQRLAFLGVGPADPDELRLQKVTLTLAAVIVTILAIIWIGTGDHALDGADARRHDWAAVSSPAPMTCPDPASHRARLAV